jgi:hypothetical protein
MDYWRLKIERYSLMSQTFFHWQAKEYHKQAKTKRWYLIATFLLAGIIFYALFTNSPIMAITFILIGVVGFLILEKNPEPIDFMITEDGIRAGNELYAYEYINSFWIVYEPEGKQYISIHTQAEILPYIKIPLGDMDPVAIREVLLDYLPEKKHTEGLIDILGDLF